MQFGKVSDPNPIDFSLMDWKVLYPADFISTHPMKIFIGTTSWVNPKWKKIIYPPNISKGSELFHYSRLFNSIELNSTFYGIPSKKTTTNWINLVPEEFRFCIKVPKSISHSPINQTNIDKIDDWNDFLSTVQPKCQDIFFQLPSYSSPELNLKRLQNLNKLNFNITNIHFEIRQPQLYDEIHLKEINNFLHELNAGLVITDTPGYRDIVHMRIYIDSIIVRFVTCGHLEIDKRRLDDWVVKITQAVKLGLKNFYFFVHDHENYPLPHLALYLQSRLSTIPELVSFSPQFQLNDGQTRLF